MSSISRLVHGAQTMRFGFGSGGLRGMTVRAQKTRSFPFLALRVEDLKTCRHHVEAVYSVRAGITQGRQESVKHIIAINASKL